MNRKSSFSALGTSVVVHGILLCSLAMIHYTIGGELPEIVLETVFDDEREQEEFTKELETENEIAETQNFIAGGAVSTAVGGSGAPAVAQQKVEQSESLQEVDVTVNPSTIDLPGEQLIGTDLGVGEVNGEVGAVVEGYGAALSRLTQELIRLMRQEKVMAVWLFDESESMKDDQKEISQKFHKVYEELGIQTRKDEALKAKDQVLLTSILSFGKGIRELTKKPTNDVNEIRAAIDKIQIDESGDENMCTAIGMAVKNYGKMARSQRRRLVIIVVSDESPSDSGDQDLSDYGLIEQAIKECEDAKAPVYVLGRESIFGYPYARIRWKDPVYQLNHWVWINRGPETAYPECLQWNGLHARHDSYPSGFGPYSQVRIAKETGGIYFMLPGEEENLVGQPAKIEARKFKALAMKEYEPLLLSRRDYEQQTANSKFRTVCWRVIKQLNPRVDKKLGLRTWHFSIEMPKFQQEGLVEFEKGTHAINELNAAIKLLDEIRPLRAKESFQRWRAAYDLMYAQCLAYRVRLFQYLLALDDHAATAPKPSDPKHNRWDIYQNKTPKEPSDKQYDRIRKAFNLKLSKTEYLAMLADERQKANARFNEVRTEHEGTPWAGRAAWDAARGYGFAFRSSFHDPRYAEIGKRIKVPKF